jgi:hypothetical protein
MPQKEKNISQKKKTLNDRFVWKENDIQVVNSQQKSDDGKKSSD